MNDRRPTPEAHGGAASDVPPGSDPNDPQFDRRPWGTFNVIDDQRDYKVKRISVDPGQRLSYQVHSHRAEHWTVVRGTARVTLDGIPFTLHPGDTINIPVGGAHRVENPGDDEMVFVEVQTGTYFGEDDIVRLDDDYGRDQNPGASSSADVVGDDRA